MNNEQVFQTRVQWWDEHVRNLHELRRPVFIQTGAWPAADAGEPVQAEAEEKPGALEQQRELCAAIARRFGAGVERSEDPDDEAGYAVLVYRGKDIAEVGFGPGIRREYFAWLELTQLALVIERYEQFRAG
ncbi:hypothetical protein [Caldimonas tepidiphila]|uniref:hypothetical protein n=1 Tax=Caldimonas tepidiphila TaxID=2315841 RepID=UPI000E5AB32C|nr:hypothetical protein [Caldimonas tepidiphila]